MRFRRTTGSMPEKVEVNMTPLIDIVFQLLAFFVMTMKAVSIEGDFNIKMPVGMSQDSTTSVNVPPFKVRLVADANGDLAAIQLGERPVNSLAALQQQVLALVGDISAASEAEVEFEFDYNLKYENVIHAITAVSAVKSADGRIVKLIEKIKFTPPNAPL